MKTYTYAYKGEPGSGFYWQVLFLTDSGIFSTAGDVGEWGYSAFSCDDIRRFVLSLDPNDNYYLPTKLAKGRKTSFDGRQTLKEAKFHILEHRKCGEITKEEAREAWNNLPQYYDSKEEWLEYFEDHEDTYGPEYWEYLCMDWDPMLKSFCKNSLPGLQELIRKELEEEALLKDQLVV